MNKFLKRFFLFSILWVGMTMALILIANFRVTSYPFKNNQTESNLLVLKEQAHYNFLVMGISHGRNLSRNTHHQKFEQVFNARMMNLSQGESLGGLENQLLYLRYFFHKNNKADTLLFVLSPSLMYNDETDQSDIAFYREPLKMSFVRHLIHYGGDRKWWQLLFYIKSKLGHHWWTTKPLDKKDNMLTLSGIDTMEMQKGFALAYPRGLNLKIFQSRCQVLDRLIREALSQNTAVTMVIPPAVFGQWPGHKETIAFLNKYGGKVKVLDHANAIVNPAFYSDHHHLNTMGVSEYLVQLEREIKEK
ncbi:MAG: hypothetical protein IPN29_14145 [Saprospiraceae bacterium]|nr:hypothetical protein [Saprospiraceae bacterium]